MARVLDVGAYILDRRGSMTAMKLQKLAYYSQAWHLVWEEQPLFPEKIQAWANGPVVYELYDAHRRQFTVSSVPGGYANKLNADESSSVDAVLDTYAGFTAQQLSELTHREDPWRIAREGVPDGSRSQNEITPAMMFEYYHGLR